MQSAPCPCPKPIRAKHVADAIISGNSQAAETTMRELIRKALDIVGRGYISAKDLVNRVEPLTNLIQVMQHLMSHNGHLKTAIIP